MKRINRRPDWRTRPAKKTISPLRGWAYLNSPLFKIRLNRQTGGNHTSVDPDGNVLSPLSFDSIVRCREILAKTLTDAMQLFIIGTESPLMKLGAMFVQGVNSAALSRLPTSEIEYRRQRQKQYQNAGNHIYPVAFPDDTVDQVRARIVSISKNIYS